MVHFATARRIVNATNKNKRVLVEGSTRRRMFWRGTASSQNKILLLRKRGKRHRRGFSSVNFGESRPAGGSEKNLLYAAC
jgi:hypothetical protein